MIYENEHEAAEGEAEEIFAAVDAAIIAARDRIEETKAVIDRTRSLLQERRDLISPINGG